MTIFYFVQSPRHKFSQIQTTGKFKSGMGTSSEIKEESIKLMKNEI
jgi:hypothetical protein